MTTSNEIVTDIYKDVISIPLEALFSDTLAYVYKDEAGDIIKQEVITGASNDNEIIIEHGLADNNEIYFAPPEDVSKMKYNPIDPKIKKEIRDKLMEAKKLRQAQMLEKMNQLKNEDLPDESSSSGGGVIILN